MDGLFKQKLLSLRSGVSPQTFAQALFENSPWPIPAKKQVAPTPKAPAPESFTEKAQVMESLERFAQEKVTELKSHVFKIDGGEIAVKPQPEWEVNSFNDQNALKSFLKLDKTLMDIVLKDKTKSNVKVIFVSEKFRSPEEITPELKEGFINELIVGFPLKTAELFHRMIEAMKLTPDEVIVYPVESASEEDYAQDVMAVCGFFEPEIIITLGAKATTRVLKSNDRLSMVHGQFFVRKIKGLSMQVVPLFHPSIIETNQNMKKTAWADMQKIMKHLKKIP